MRLLLARPDLLADHAQAYAELVAADFSDASAALTRRVIVGGAGVLCLLVATFLAGVALLLDAVTTAAQMQAPWALVVVPLVPLVASVACLVWVRAQRPLTPLAQLRIQARTDLDMLRERGAPCRAPAKLATVWRRRADNCAWPFVRNRAPSVPSIARRPPDGWAAVWAA